MAPRFFRLRAAAVALAVAAPGVAQPPSPQQVVADQRAADQVRRVLAAADLVGRKSPAEGKVAVQQGLTALYLDTAVSAAQRAALERQLLDKVTSYDARPEAADPRTAKQRTAQRQLAEAGAAEAAEVKAAVAEVGKLYDAGKPTDARVRAAALLRKYPNNPAALVLVDQGAVADRLAEARRLAHDMAERWTAALNQVQQSAIPAVKDMELAKDWKERQALRDRLRPRLDPDSERILQALEKPAGPGLANLPFEETLQTLSTLCGQPLYLDEPSLDGVDRRRPVTVPNGVSVRTALRVVLQSQGLTFVIRDKAIVGLSLERAREALVTRHYYLGDAVAAGFGGGVGLGPIADAQQTEANAKVIVDAITRGVDPMVWKEKGGPASISFHLGSLSLVVRAPAEVHAGLATRLK